MNRPDVADVAPEPRPGDDIHDRPEDACDDHGNQMDGDQDEVNAVHRRIVRRHGATEPRVRAGEQTAVVAVAGPAFPGMALLIGGIAVAVIALAGPGFAEEPPERGPSRPGTVVCGKVLVGAKRDRVCFSRRFLRQVQRKTTIWTEPKMEGVELGSGGLARFPFAVLTGDGPFRWTDAERRALRRWLERGGFGVASPWCGCERWNESFRRELRRTFPGTDLWAVPRSHPLFHTVFEKMKVVGTADEAELEALFLGDRLALVYASDGLNDSRHTRGDCPPCLRGEIRHGSRVTANALAYALTR